MNTPSAGTDSIYIRLAGPNRFTMRTKKGKRKVGFGGGFATPGYAVSDQDAVAGDLSLELCYTQAQLLLDWASTRVNAGQTTPWVTTEPPGDLASCHVYHGVKRDDGTVRRRGYIGVKVTHWNLTSSAESGLTMLKLGLRAKRALAADPDGTAFPAPADTAFPTDPVLFVQSSGLVTVAGSALLYLEGLSLDVTNGLDAKYFASQFLTFDRLRGRQSKAELDVLYTASPEWRTEMEAVTSQAVSVGFTNTTHTVTVSLEGNVLLDDVTDDLTPGKVYTQKLAMETQYDTSAGADLAFTFA